MSDAFPMPADLEACAREPIHIPGSIQPHGYLFVLNEADLKVVAASRNAATALSVSPSALIGRPIADLLVSATSASLDAALRAPHDETAIRVRLRRSTQSVEWEGLIHRIEGLILLELTPGIPADRAGALFRQVWFAIERIRASGSTESACEALAVEIRRLTGFDRVMVYRFDSDWNGEVVAEDKSADVQSYRGHTFPAADIPAQARALYTRNTVRLIPDARYIASRIVPATLPSSGLPIDLSSVICVACRPFTSNISPIWGWSLPCRSQSSGMASSGPWWRAITQRRVHCPTLSFMPASRLPGQWLGIWTRRSGARSRSA